MKKRRVVRLDGVANFRDIGGKKTRDGGTVKSGILFRSGDLSRLSENDEEILRKFRLKVVCDLRTQHERTTKHDRLPPYEDLRLVHIPITPHGQDVSRLKLLGHLFRKSGEECLVRFMHDIYSRIAFNHTAQIHEILSLISDPTNLPALIHCVAGRDRTGYVSALIQMFAGVPRSAVVEDYLLTNHAYELRIKRWIRVVRLMSLFTIPTDRIQRVCELRPDYLETILDEIVTQYGTVDGYLNSACGFHHDELRELRHLLLE